MASLPKIHDAHELMGRLGIAITRTHLAVLIIAYLVAAPTLVRASAEYSILGTPTCDPPGRYRAGEKLDFAASKKNGAVVDSDGFSFLRTDQLTHCVNWCCKLPAVNCSIAMLEIKPTGANCHLVTCYPTEMCVFISAVDFVSYDRTLFVPKEAYNLTTTEATATRQKGGTNPASKFSFIDQLVPASPNQDPQHDSAIKPRKGVEQPPPPPSDDNRTETKGSADQTANGPTVNSAPRRKTPVATIFLYSAIILGLLVTVAFFGQKFLDCWERRHYTRADYLLDGMYEDRQMNLKSQSPCH